MTDNKNEIISEVGRIDERGIPGPVTSSKKEKKDIINPVKSSIMFYKLNFRRPNGDIRSDISKSVVHNLVINWADLLRIIPSNRWSTLEEIVNLVWDWEKRQYRQIYPPRSRQQIESGVSELVLAGVILQKS